MNCNELLNKKYEEKLDKIDHNIDLALSDIAACIKSFLPNNPERKKEKRAVKNNNVKELVPFIQNILHFFHAFPDDNFEELLLPHVGEIRQQNFLPLIDEEQLIPCKNCEWDENQSSISAENSDDLTPKIAWEMLCWHLEKYIQKQLSTQSKSLEFDTKMSRFTWQYYLQKLNNVLSSTRLWEFHIHLRIYQLNFYKCSCFKKSNLYCLNCFTSLCIDNFIEDTIYITTGSFGNMVLTRNDLYTFYARKVSNFVSAIFDNIESYNKSPLDTGLLREMKCFHLTESWCKISPKAIKSNMTDLRNCKIKFPETILLQIIDTLNIFEEKTLGVANKTSQSYLNLNDLIMSLPIDSPDQSPIHQTTGILNTTNEKQQKGFWNWRLAVVEKGFLNILQRRLHNSVSESVMEACNREWKIFCETRNPGHIEIVMDNHFRYRVMNSAVTTIELLDSYKPLLAASCGALFPFCASFCHVIHTYLVDLIEHVKKISENASIDCCYLSLYTCIYLIEKLSVYGDFCSCGGKGESQLQILIGTVQNQLTEWIDFLKLRIITHHLKGILCGILQDSESNNWEESKSFFENERISHCLTVWNIYMKKLINDMKQCLPPDITYELYGRILRESINHLTARYSKVKPSESRTIQLKVDITFLLFCVSEFLPQVCISLDEYLGLTDNRMKIEKFNNTVKEIHSNCCSLLLVLAVVTTPLGALCKIYKNGFPQLNHNSEIKGKSNWLSWLHPVLFRKSKDGYLISSTNVWLVTKISTAQNSPIPSLVLHSITMHTSTLAILLMTQASKLPKEQDHLKLELANSILNILKHASHKPCSLGLAIIPVINSCNEWEIFDGHLVITSSSVKKPWWYTALAQILQAYLKDSIGSSLTTLLRLATVLDSPSIKEWKTIYLHLRQVVRCSCNETQVIDRETAIFLLGLKLQQNLVESISTIPQTILFCLLQLQEQLNEANTEIKPLRDSVGIHILHDIVYNDLKNDSFIEECLGQKSTKEMNLMCDDVAECILSLTTPDAKFKEQSIPLWCLNESKQNLIQIEHIFQSKIDKSDYQHESDEEDNISQMVIDVLRDSKGPSSIKYLHDIMRNNTKWIQTSLGIPGILCSDMVVNSVCPSPLPLTMALKSKGEDSDSLCIPEDDSYKDNWQENETSPVNLSEVLDLDPPKERDKNHTPLNILEEFEKIGDHPYSYDTIANVKYFWEALLSHLPFMGLTEEGFKGLLINRWDINNLKLLSEGEKRGVQILRQQYGLDRQKPPLT